MQERKEEEEEKEWSLPESERPGWEIVAEDYTCIYSSPLGLGQLFSIDWHFFIFFFLFAQVIFSC